MNIRKSLAAAGTLAAALALTFTTAGSAGAAGLGHEFWNSDDRYPGSAYFVLKNDSREAGRVYWIADPGHFGRNFGDSVYVSDTRSDGYSVRGQAKTIEGGKMLWNASTAGKTAPASARSTDNVKEGTYIFFRGCLEKKGVSYGCTPWRVGRA
ncbi:hypothetical protein [Streptomyces poriticola]|uniref:hypothetical protein n=1 Tax=Streptomyces poriticola TaxID=3120506 RepID=UPI002FCE29F5